VVVEVFLNMTVLFMQFLALWNLRFSKPGLPRKKIPGGYAGLFLATLGPSMVILLAIYSQLVEEGLNSLWLALVLLPLGPYSMYEFEIWLSRVFRMLIRSGLKLRCLKN
jgi:amino acid transporter